MTLHSMIDLETFDTGPNAAIAMVGLAVFNPLGGEKDLPFIQRWSWGVSLQSSLLAGLDYSEETRKWWRRQSVEARASLINRPCLPLEEVLGEMREKMERYEALSGVWSHGAGFDLPIVDSAHRALGLQLPWKFWNARDTRTLFWLAEAAGWEKPERSNDLVLHDAGADAVYQAICVMSAVALLRLRSVPGTWREDFDVAPGDEA